MVEMSESGFEVEAEAGYTGSLSLSLEARHRVEVASPVNPPFRLSTSLKVHL